LNKPETTPPTYFHHIRDGTRSAAQGGPFEVVPDGHSEIAVQTDVVTLSAEERERLHALIRSGKHPARKLMRARLLLKACACEACDAWGDSQIAAALDTGVATVARTRQQLVEAGVEGVLTPKRSPNSVTKPIFGGVGGLRAVDAADAGRPRR